MNTVCTTSRPVQKAMDRKAGKAHHGRTHPGKVAGQVATVHRSVPAALPRGLRVPAKRESLASRMDRIEDKLVAATLATHPRADAAWDRVLDDLSHPNIGSISALRPPPSPSPSPARLSLIHDHLLAAVIDNHPRREQALGRLLDDITGITAGPTDPESADIHIDMDWDGLG